MIVNLGSIGNLMIRGESYCTPLLTQCLYNNFLELDHSRSIRCTRLPRAITATCLETKQQHSSREQSAPRSTWTKFREDMARAVEAAFRDRARAPAPTLRLPHPLTGAPTDYVYDFAAEPMSQAPAATAPAARSPLGCALRFARGERRLLRGASSLGSESDQTRLGSTRVDPVDPTRSRSESAGSIHPTGTRLGVDASRSTQFDPGCMTNPSLLPRPHPRPSSRACPAAGGN